MIPTSPESSKEQLFGEFSAVLGEAEQLIRNATAMGAETAGTWKGNVESGLAAAAERLAKIRAESLYQAKAAGRSADRYIQENPWQALGLVAAICGATGIVAGMLIARR